jgi:hypothetical protein
VPKVDKRPVEARKLLAEAALWRLTGLLFQRPVSGWLDEVRSLSREVGDRALAEVADLVGSAEEGGYLALLGPGGSVSPREVGHRPTVDPGRLLADLRGFYRAFAFTPRSEDPDDHIANEAGFYGYLRLKEAYAVHEGDDEARSVTRRAAEEFRRAHLEEFALALAAKIEASDAPPYLTASAADLRRRLGGLDYGVV